MPFFSIVVPLYNKADYVVEGVFSILNQSFEDFEVIIINDGSTDDGLEKVSAIRDPRVRIYSQDNAGVSVARNKGISLSVGKYICFLDADDCYAEDVLAHVYDYILCRGRGVRELNVLCLNYDIKKNGRVHARVINLERGKVALEPDGRLNDFFKQAAAYPGSFPCNVCTVFVSRVFLEKEKIRFAEGIAHTEDVAFVSALALRTHIYFSNFSGMTYNLDADNNSKSTRKTSGRYIIDYLKEILVHGVNDRHYVEAYLLKNIIHLMMNCIYSNSAADFYKWRSDPFMRKSVCSLGYVRYYYAFKYLPFWCLRLMYLGMRAFGFR